MNPVTQPKVWEKPGRGVGGSERVRVKRHRPDINYLVEEVVERLAFSPGEEPSFLYLNPLATVTCDRPSRNFIRKARKCLMLKRLVNAEN